MKRGGIVLSCITLLATGCAGLGIKTARRTTTSPEARYVRPGDGGDRAVVRYPIRSRSGRPWPAAGERLAQHVSPVETEPTDVEPATAPVVESAVQNAVAEVAPSTNESPTATDVVTVSASEPVLQPLPDTPPPAPVAGESLETIPPDAGEVVDAEPYVEPPAFHDLDLSTALSLVGGHTPRVAIAHERVVEAYADWRAAKVLWLPSIGAGLSVNRHDGTLQASNGAVTDVDRTSLQTGLGVGAVGAGTVTRPGLVARFHTADAWFQPLIAERATAARRYAESAELNDQLLATAVAYMNLLEAEQLVAVARTSRDNTEELVRVTTAFADSGEGNQADADRAETELSLRRNELARAEEAVAVASARLTEVLSLDATLRMRPLEPALVPIDLVACECGLRELVARGLGQRPELRESSALIGEAVRRLQREKSAPLVPSLLLGASVSGFGGGPGGRVDNFQDRVDLDAMVTWEVRNLGYGEKAARDRARATVRRTRSERIRAMDIVAREIAVAHARVTARSSQIAIAEEGVAKAEDSYRRNLDRINEGQGLPLEVLQSIQALDAARRDYVRTIADFNEAQFELHRALGWPIRM